MVCPRLGGGEGKHELSCKKETDMEESVFLCTSQWFTLCGQGRRRARGGGRGGKG